MHRFAFACLFAALAATAALADDVGPALGKERAAASRTEWGTRDGVHFKLGNVRSAFTRNPVETQAGDASVYTRATVSCDPGTRRIAIELANAGTPEGAGGLKPAATTVLLCSRPIAPWDAKLVQEELTATWEVDAETGIALARGLRPFPLRECVAIRAEQTLALPGGKKARVDFEILPYGRELDSVFAACGERSAYAPAQPAPVAAVAQTPPPAAAPVSPKAESTWRRARVTGSGNTNVRAGPTLQSAIVAQVSAGGAVMVQSTDTEWWRAKATRGAGFVGYIRQDRLALE